jgi:alpha-amylase/alpha-mannosidase (GH57 family)
MARKLYLNLMWHMHQPYYRDPVTRVSSMPWVRLHGTKDYLDMPLLLEEYPRIKSTFNLVPSLLMQVEEYTEEGLSDELLDLTRKPAEDLSAEDKLAVLKGFFMANGPHMIEPHARYAELAAMRGAGQTDQALAEAGKRWAAQDFRDLQVWFNLAWVDPYLRERDPQLKALVEKGRLFSEEDKHLLISKHLEMLRAVVPAYRRLQDKGQIEVTTTPFFHPILPLLCDTDIARVGMPGVTLPSHRFSHPEDAQAQVKTAVEFMQRRFGQAPQGMWPSEGSVSDEVLTAIAQAGFAWAATDEEILAMTLGRSLEVDGYGKLMNPDFLYKPYRFERDGRHLDLLFRDHRLSDKIGFHYSGWNAEDAAADLVCRLLEILDNPASGECPLVNIILDGENAWEYYPQDGLPFFRALYQRLSEEERIETVRPSDYLQRFPPTSQVDHIFPGSWINHDFGIWLGHPEDNKSWDLLGETRDAVVRWEAEHPAPEDRARARMAWHSLHIAEGSDWNWWYGDDHSSALDGEFDRLYRLHLANAYRALGEPIPRQLFLPISGSKAASAWLEPSNFIHPTPEGRVSHYYEWRGAGKLDTARMGGAMHQAEPFIRHIHFGCDLLNLHLRIDARKALHLGELPDLARLGFEVKFLDAPERRARVEFSGERAKPRLLVFDEAGLLMGNDGARMAAEDILEMSLPFSLLGLSPGREGRFIVTATQDEVEMEHWPPSSPITFRVPEDDSEDLAWTV